MSRRIQGKASFAEIQDSNGKIQLYFNRDEICKYLNDNGIETRPIIAGNIARQPANNLFDYRISGKLLNSDNIMDNGFSIGVHQSLCAESIEYVKEVFDNFFKERKVNWKLL